MHQAVSTLLHMKHKVKFIGLHAEPEVFFGEDRVVGIKEFCTAGIFQIRHSLFHIGQGIALQKALDILCAESVFPGGFHTGQTHANQGNILGLLAFYIPGDGFRVGKAAGESFTVNAPAGSFTMKVVSVSREG